MRKAMVVAGLLAGVGCGISAAAPRTDRTDKGSPFIIKQASDSPVSGYEKVTLGERTVYVAPDALLTGADLTAVEVGPGRGGSALIVDITPQAAPAITNIAQKGGTQSVALFVDGRLHAVGTLDNVQADAQGVTATIGGMTEAQAERFAKLVDSKLASGSGAIVTAVPAGQSGDLYLVDVFVQGARNLRAYQVKLDVAGGTSGTLTRTNLVIDKNRPDFVFGRQEVVLAEDKVGGRAGAVLFTGSVETAKPAYLGTYSFKASPDARGTFKISVQASEETILADTRNENMGYTTGPAAEITIGQNPNPRAGR